MRADRMNQPIIAMLCAALLAGGTVQAQKRQDTVRIAFVDPIATVLTYDDPKPETAFTTWAIFDGLLCYDPQTGEFAPLLAESWSWVDERTLEVRLRTDVRFHDGSVFDAEDAVYTLNWLVDPATRLRFADNYRWIERATKTGTHTLRIRTTHASPVALLRLAVGTPMLPSDRHGAQAITTEFGRKAPIGTGPFRAETVSADRGIVLVRNERFQHGNRCKPAGKVARIRVLPIPDTQTQIAELMTGGLDVAKVAQKDQADFLAKQPMFRMTANHTITYHYLAIDAINRSGNAALADLKVRQAIAHAIDRELVARSVVPGGEAVVTVDALCVRVHRACDFSSRPPSYDPAAAKRLLAEAGLMHGLDVEMTATPGSYALAEALAGELRKVGIRAKVDRVTFIAYREKQRQGKIQLLVGQWSSGGFPDASSPVEFFFGENSRDYWRDPIIETRLTEGLHTTDDARRKAIYRQIFDRVNARVYILPIASKPDVFVHAKDLAIETGSLNAFGADPNGIGWR
ncbi:MAG: ABC transporter substrate-binding protein [Burkholderiales bacterium]